jgi:hypothetical protein
MTLRLSSAHLDEILALQLGVAWAGEAAGEPARLGWWKSDLVDREGGGDLLARLVPRTAAWASLVLVRAVACRVDKALREKVAGGDTIWTLFRFGFAIDEQLAERLAYHRSHQHVPADVFGPRFILGKPWSRASFEALLTSLGTPKTTATPAGRQVDARGVSPLEAAPLLAAALLPLAPAYPLPFLAPEAPPERAASEG